MSGSSLMNDYNYLPSTSSSGWGFQVRNNSGPHKIYFPTGDVIDLKPVTQ
jgi:hypothetical protein